MLLRPAFVIMAMGAMLSVAAAGPPAPAAAARTPNSDMPFCAAVLSFSSEWPQINLDFPGQPFFSDGNNDGIADLLQVGHAKLPSLGSGLQVLAARAPANLKTGLSGLARDVQVLATQRAPLTAAQSRQEVKPVEQAASGVQRALKGEGCLAKVTAANAAADQAAEGTGSGSRGQGASVAILLVFLVVNLPLIWRLWRHARRPAVKGDGSGFKGNVRRWSIDTITGEVLHVDRSTRVLTSYGAPIGPAGYPPGSTVWSETEVVRLRVADGPPKTESLVNFEAYPNEGDLVTVCVAHSRSTRVPFALLNHTTKKQDVQLQSLFRLREGGTARQLIMVFSLIFGAIVTVVLAVFGGAPWVIALWLVLMVMFVVTSRREASIDVRPLWRRADEQLEMLPS